MQEKPKPKYNYTIVGLNPFTNYTFSVFARVRFEYPPEIKWSNWSPAARASATTNESLALTNPIVRAPLVERLSGDSSGASRVRVFWDNPTTDELGGHLVKTSVEAHTQQNLLPEDRVESKAPLNWAGLSLGTMENVSVLMRSHTALGTNSSRPATRIRLSPELEKLGVENVCWITVNQSNSHIAIDQIKFQTKSSAISALAVLCTGAMDWPCLIQAEAHL